MFRQLLQHASYYTVGNILMMVAGLVSFPIITRLVSVADYGLMTLMSSLLGIAVVFGKLGVQHAIVRFHAESVTAPGTEGEKTFTSTVMLSLLGFGLVVTAIWLAIAAWAPASLLGNAQMRELMWLTAVLVLTRSLDSGLVNILRAEQRAAVLALYNVIKKYTTVAAIVGMLLYVNVAPLNGFFIATVVMEVLTTIVLSVYMLRRLPIAVSVFSPVLLGTMMAYGLPMLAQELAAMLLLQGDRYVIQSLLGSVQLGIYSAGYNLSEYIKSILVLSLGMALIPMYTRLWVEKGVGPTRIFVERAMHFYVIAGVALGCGISAVATELITLLASAKFAPAAAVIPWVIFGMVVDGANPLLAAGIYLRKKTWVIMLLMIGAAGFNLGLNFMLVPYHGIIGSAIASSCTMLLLSLAMWLAGRRELPLSLPLWHLAKMGAAGVAAYYLACTIHVDLLVLRIALRLLVGAVALGVLVWLLDPVTRGLLSQGLARLRRRP
ncbi:MAG: hypothetical protein RLZZ618_3074 [Pseudomonadota bacterium]|jgi:O-antigen/teichoic acid export membrane protein